MRHAQAIHMSRGDASAFAGMSSLNEQRSFKACVQPVVAQRLWVEDAWRKQLQHKLTNVGVLQRWAKVVYVMQAATARHRYVFCCCVLSDDFATSGKSNTAMRCAAREPGIAGVFGREGPAMSLMQLCVSGRRPEEAVRTVNVAGL